MPEPALAVHGGAGDWSDVLVDAAASAAVRVGLAAALAGGRDVLAAGGTALDAVQAAVRVLEDDPWFNAGRGAALTRSGHVELDAAVHDGASGRAGAVAGLRRTRHPVDAARLVLERSPHVLLAGPDAEAWLAAAGAEPADPAWLATTRARERLARALAGGRSGGGTVGAVARDAAGRLAAATSTGGTTGKLPGRIGDSPLIGSGTWADAQAAVSATGHGEAFIRAAFAVRCADSVAAGATPEAAAHRGLATVAAQGGDGGCIVIAAAGAPSLPFSSAAMARGWWTPAGEGVAIGRGAE